MVIHEHPVYATQPAPLRAQIAQLLRDADTHAPEGTLMGVIVPDANLLSGSSIAADVYAAVAETETEYDSVIIIAPSHTGTFRRLTICSVDAYHTPLGPVAINDQMRNELCDEDDDIFLDDRGHYQNAGVDVQIPFLQQIVGSFDLVPIVMGEETPELCKELGNAVGEIMYNRRTLLVACANIVEADEEGLAQFKEQIETMDVSRLMALLNSETVHVQGKGAILTALIATLHRRGNHAQVIGLQAPKGEEPGYVGALLWRS